MLKVKFNSSSVRTRVLPILKFVAAGNYPAKVARLLGMSKPHVSYYLKRLERAGLIRRDAPKWPSFYSLTEKGSNFLTGCERSLAPSFVFRLHNVVFKYPILGEGGFSVDWRCVEKMNWSSLIGSELGLTVEKTTRHVLVYCDVVSGRDPDELLLLAKDQADRVAAHLQLKYGLRLGDGKLCRKPHFGVYDPVAALLGKYWQLSDDVGKVDESEGYGEIDWFSSESAKEYLLMPGYIRKLLEIQQTFAVAMEQHMVLIKKLQDLVKALKAVIEKGDKG